jgi:hypothetical protein
LVPADYAATTARFFPAPDVPRNKSALTPKYSASAFPFPYDASFTTSA